MASTRILPEGFAVRREINLQKDQALLIKAYFFGLSPIKSRNSVFGEHMPLLPRLIGISSGTPIFGSEPLRW